MSKLLSEVKEIPHGTSIDDEGASAAMRSPVEKDEQESHNRSERMPEEKYGNSTEDEDAHPERNPGVGQIGGAR